MKITFVMPCVGKKKNEVYVKSWQMEPLAIAVLSSLTPPGHEKVFYDDRIEPILYDEKTDLVAINVETYTARRAYQIAEEFQKRNVKVIMGGFHATLVPQEVQEHSDSIVIGAAEPLWQEILSDFKNGKLKKVYDCSGDFNFTGVEPDRTIYKDKQYLKLALVETGRGCLFNCDFCSICNFFKHKYFRRKIDDIIIEIKNLSSKFIFFIDDNLGADKDHLAALLSALIPLKIKWVGQISMDIANNNALLDLMNKSGCMGVLIGFESLDPANINQMNKKINTNIAGYHTAVKNLRKNHIALYATFVFGYDADTEQTFKTTFDFSAKHRFFFTAFNHLIPFPGTPLYSRLQKENRLIFEKWWLEKGYHFGDIAYHPKNFNPGQLSDLCLQYRKKYYSILSVIRRGLDCQVNSRDLTRASIFWVQNLINRKDILRRQGLPLGIQD